MIAPAVLKLGGELLDEPERLQAVAALIARVAQRGPLIVIHGGGRSIDTELARRGIPKRAVEGVRITDAGTLDVVVAVLAGLVNTRLVASVAAAGARAVGLTGADGSIGLVEPAAPLRTADGRVVDLELVGQPTSNEPPTLLLDLCQHGYVPIIASIGAARDGRLFNVNADTMAAHLAASVKAPRLVIAGTTAGVLDERRETIPFLDGAAIEQLIAAGDARDGMVAKLASCREAIGRGVREIFIVDGREPSNIENCHGTRIAA